MGLPKGKRRVIVIGILSIGIFGFAFAQESGNLTVEVSGMKSNEGVVRIALYKSRKCMTI